MGEVKVVIDQISKASGLSELAKVTKYNGYLDGVGEVQVTVRDRGEDERYRFGVSARTLDLEEERTAAGNPERDLDTAIAVVHWKDLTR